MALLESGETRVGDVALLGVELLPDPVLFAGIFLSVVGPCFCGGFGENVVVERGFLVVKLRWIAGESW